jgi:hypothetical protein
MNDLNGMSNETPFLPNPSNLSALAEQFRQRYPVGAIVSELLTVHQNEYVVRASVQIGGTICATGMAAASTIESAEDRAKLRVLQFLLGDSTQPPRVDLGLRSLSSLSPLPSTVPTPEPSLAAEESVTSISATPAPSIPSLLDTAPIPEMTAKPTPEKTVGKAITPPPELDVESFPALDLLQPIEPAAPAPMLELEARSQSADAPSILDSSSALPLEDFPEPEPTPAKKSKPAKSTKSEPPQPSPEPSEPQDSQDYSDIIAKIDVEMMRLGWNASKGREHLKTVYGKRSRQQLSYAELLDFLAHLEAQAS